MTDMIWSFAPWIAFLTALRFGSIYWGAAAGVVVGVIVLVRALSRHDTHLFDVIGPVYFVGMLALLAIVHPGDISTWGRYAQAVAHASLTIVVFGSVLINRPFTEAYARKQAPPEVWSTPGFRAFNRRISAVWGVAFLAGTVSLLLAGSTDSRQVLLRIIIPFGALVLAFSYTQRQAAAAKEGRLRQ